jgi:prepilin-type N-terminal cleavage/methylation domain-containing protein
MVTRRTPGYTLVELLIVIMIAVMLMAITLPVAKTVMEDGRPREASRILNATLAAVKARAVQTNRLAGLDFVCERMNDPMAMTPVYQVTQLYMCEVPPMYAGDIINARVVVDTSTGTLNFGSGAGSLYSLLDPNQTTKTFKIRINHRGPWYDCNTSDGTTYYIALAGMPYPPTGDANGYAYQILRPPVRIGNPIELPKATALDMTYSGVGPKGTEFANADALRLMFGPQGNVQEVIKRTAGGGITSGVPNGTLHFLIGQTGKITDASNYNNVELSNLADGNTFWVSIGHSSGLVTTSENLPDPSLTDAGDYLKSCRQAAISREQKGGL